LSTVGGVGFKGAFVMGLVMGLIAAPCTGPFLTGILAVISQSKSYALGGAALFSFALGLGVLFFVAGTFAVNLPKGGAWMLGIKWGSGVALAYMALAYLRDGFPALAKIIQPTMTFVVVAGVIMIVGLVLGGIHIAAERRKSPIAHLSKPMKLASIVPAIVGTFLVFSWTPAHGDGGGGAEIAWLPKEQPALEQAAKENKPILIDFGATWCKACKELDEKTWPDARVKAEAERFVNVKIDATDEDDPEIKRLTAKYKVVGLPTVVALDSEGKERVRFTEFVEPDKMAAAIKPVK
jgi:thiol:disulfide interchange protein DsbD